MPIYEYACGSCGHRFDALLARSDERPPVCPKCGAAGVEKLPSAFAVARGTSGSPAPSCGTGGCGCCRD